MLLFCNFINSAPWIGFENNNLLNKVELVEKKCSISLHQISEIPYPVSIVLSNIRDKINEINDEDCKNNLVNLSDEIKNYFNQEFLLIGFQSSTDDLFLQDRRKKYYKNTNIYLNYSKTKGSFHTNLSLINDVDDSKIYFDNSYISYKYKNQVISYGRIDRWWSPSKISSPILSNNSRPSIGISIENYIPINFDLFILNKFKDIRYTIFLNKLEKNRTIPNALLFGNRLSFSPYKNLDISLLRVAQFGGDGRPINKNVIIDMLLGKDNTNRNLSFEDQPGNQLGGIDFNYKHSIKRDAEINFYGQILGEDGIDPLNKTIQDIRFPSKRFGQFGFQVNMLNLNFGAEYLNTYNGTKNNTYSHSLYKTGYRFLGKTIGASIDADSISYTIHASKKFNLGNELKVKLTRADINKHNRNNNYISSENIIINDINVIYSFQINKKLRSELFYVYRNSIKNDHAFFMRLEYIF